MANVLIGKSSYVYTSTDHSSWLKVAFGKRQGALFCIRTWKIHPSWDTVYSSGGVCHQRDAVRCRKVSRGRGESERRRFTIIVLRETAISMSIICIQIQTTWRSLFVFFEVTCEITRESSCRRLNLNNSIRLGNYGKIELYLNTSEKLIVLCLY